MDCSPTSPGQASDLSEIFEPPKTVGGGGGGGGAGSSSAKKSARKSFKSSKSKGPRTSASAAAKTSRSVQMKLIDDKLRIIDDVPTSAVEMAVKEKVPFWGKAVLGLGFPVLIFF